MAGKRQAIDANTLRQLLETCTTQVDAQESSYHALSTIDYTVSVYWDICADTNARKLLAFWVTDRSDETFARFGLKNPDRPAVDPDHGPFDWLDNPNMSEEQAEDV